MGRVLVLLAVAIAAILLPAQNLGQNREDMCEYLWINPGSALGPTSIIYGRVSIKRPTGSTAPKVVVRLRDGRSNQQLSFSGSGSYCFEKSNTAGEIIVDINGEQLESRPVIANTPEQREDFRFNLTGGQTPAPPGVVLAKFPYKRTGKNSKLMERALRAVADKRPDQAIQDLTAIVENDPGDYVAGATLGSVYFHQKKYSEAEDWLKRSLQIKPDFTPAWISLARAQYAGNKYDVAIESSKKAIMLEPNSAVAFYILGEIYLRTAKGNLAVEALNEAIKLDPVGMAECHLILADLYDLNGAKKMASREYQAFLAKMPNHHNKQKIEQYVRDNPPE